MPVGYHGRASTIVVSGTDGPPAARADRRSATLAAHARSSTSSASSATSAGRARSGPIADRPRRGAHLRRRRSSTTGARATSSALEYEPLGPFLGKSFATSMSAWITPLRRARATPASAPPPAGPVARAVPRGRTTPWLLDIELEIELQRRGSSGARSARRPVLDARADARPSHRQRRAPFSAGDLVRHRHDQRRPPRQRGFAGRALRREALAGRRRRGRPARPRGRQGHWARFAGGSSRAELRSRRWPRTRRTGRRTRRGRAPGAPAVSGRPRGPSCSGGWRRRWSRRSSRSSTSSCGGWTPTCRLRPVAGDRRNLASIKGVLEQNGWFLTTPISARPSVSPTTTSRPIGDVVHYVLVWLLGLVLGDPVVVFNAFFLLCFPLIAVVGYAVLRDLGSARAPALVAGLLFAFLPYHMNPRAAASVPDVVLRDPRWPSGSSPWSPRAALLIHRAAPRRARCSSSAPASSWARVRATTRSSRCSCC